MLIMLKLKILTYTLKYILVANGLDDYLHFFT